MNIPKMVGTDTVSSGSRTQSELNHRNKIAVHAGAPSISHQRVAEGKVYFFSSDTNSVSSIFGMETQNQKNDAQIEETMHHLAILPKFILRISDLLFVFKVPSSVLILEYCYRFCEDFWFLLVSE